MRDELLNQTSPNGFGLTKFDWIRNLLKNIFIYMLTNKQIKVNREQIWAKEKKRFIRTRLTEILLVGLPQVSIPRPREPLLIELAVANQLSTRAGGFLSRSQYFRCVPGELLLQARRAVVELLCQVLHAPQGRSLEALR